MLARVLGFFRRLTWRRYNLDSASLSQVSVAFSSVCGFAVACQLLSGIQSPVKISTTFFAVPTYRHHIQANVNGAGAALSS